MYDFLFSTPMSKSLYLDPGSGSMILQLILAAALGLAVIVRTQWERIKKLFGKNQESRDEEDQDE